MAQSLDLAARSGWPRELLGSSIMGPSSPKQERSKITVTLDHTDDPEFAGSPPMQAEVSVDDQAIHIRAIHAESAEPTLRDAIEADGLGELLPPEDPVRSVDFKILSGDSRSVAVRYDVSIFGGIESTMTIRHRDPYEVVESFATSLTSGKSYWIRAVAKMFEDKLDIKAEEE